MDSRQFETSRYRRGVRECSVTPSDLDRFQKILGMLGSEHDGERAAAALKATSWLKEHGLSWSDMVVPVPVEEISEADLLAHRRDAMREAQRQKYDRNASEFRGRTTEEVWKARREQWDRQAQQPDSDGFWADMREDIRKTTGGEDGTRDPRVRK